MVILILFKQMILFHNIKFIILFHDIILILVKDERLEIIIFAFREFNTPALEK